ncbi:MAG TPA: endolytic transglycosylase MltG [Flavobacteriaceae bacterium]|nr:endolytic transglycosylase MltG [Flavobacteriaceae bacterium]
MYIKKILLAVALIGLLIFGGIAYYIYNTMFALNTTFEADVEYIYIPTNATYSQVREQLNPLVKDIESFDALAQRKQYTSSIKAGKFPIKKGMSNNDIINSIRINNTPVRVSFNNQESLKKLAGRISEQIEADSLSLYTTMTDSAFLKKMGFDKKTALGMYIPNSYEFFWNTSAEDFCNRMLKEYNAFWNEARNNKAKAIGLSRDEVMTLASIVHEESKQREEQPRIAGVYMNRIRIGMPLQADPTLKFAAYQLPQYQDVVIKRVLNIHKEIESPYNTYKYAGLPPGLIAMPDISAIDAVLNYEHHSYLYFAADAKRLGFHKFAKTLAQHNVNAREYQKYLSTQGINR